MTGWRFVWKGLRYYRWSYVGVFLASVLGSMVLLGGLFAGDSVKKTLQRLAGERIGKVDYVFTGGDRFFRAALADELGESGLEAAPVMVLEGTVSAQASGLGVGRVRVVGVDPSFWQLSPGAMDHAGQAIPTPGEREFFVNEHLARLLGVAGGDGVVLRMREPSLLAAEAPMGGEAEDGVTLRGTIGEVVPPRWFGRFSLEATQLPTATMFVPIARLQEAVGFEGKANMLLIRDRAERESDEVEGLVRDQMKLADYGITLEPVAMGGAVEVRTERVFFDQRVEEVLRRELPGAEPVVTYLANTIAANGRETPYSMVTAVGRGAAPFLPEGMADDGIVLNAWEAEDLGAGVGDEVTLQYFVVQGGSRLVEEERRFKVAGIVPLDGLAADRSWMPDFPGVAEVDNAKDWRPGMPLDLTRIRDKDETYWDDHKGTPKAFVSRAAGEAMWKNRWGRFTGLRVTGADPDTLEPRLTAALNPAVAGLTLQSFRAEAVEAAASPVDIAALFLSMSFFLIVAAVALTALLFRFNVELRNRESGLLAALGVPGGKLLRWRLTEGACIVLAGSLMGALLAVAYTVGILRFLETIWSASAGERWFDVHVNPASLAGGLLGFVLFVMVAIWWAVRNQARRSASMRLEAGVEEIRVGRKWLPLIQAAVCAVVGISLTRLGGVMGPQGAFFLAGFLILLAGLLLYRWCLAGSASDGRRICSVGGLAAVNRSRRPARSLVVVGTLAAGVFLVVAVASFRKDTGDEAREATGGSGGFGLWIETTNALGRGSGEDGARDYFGLGQEAEHLGEVVAFRVGTGEDGNCFNLNSVRQPRLLATDVSRLAQRGSFTIKKVADGLERSWTTLSEGEVMRAFVDETTLMWVLKKKPGDRITYADEWGEPFEVEIAGSLADSVFQGSFVVDEAQFLKRFPSAAGHRLFLAEVGRAQEDTLRNEIQRSLADEGAVVTGTMARLEAFHGVENTYIAIFHVLGGLGVILGSAGLGLVTARNLAERRYEFAVMNTMGIPRRVAARLVFREVGSFIRWGVGIGLIAALVAITPVLAGGDPLRVTGWVALLVVATAANAWFWSWLGYRASMKRVMTMQQEFA